MSAQISPLPFGILQKFCVPGAQGLTIVLPIEDKLGDQLLGKGTIDISHMEDIKNRFVGSPIRADGPGFKVGFKGVGESGPLAFDMLDKARIPGGRRDATLLPVENKFGNGILHKVAINVCLDGQDFHGLRRRPPVCGHGDVLALPEILSLLLPPESQDMFEIPGSPAVLWLIALRPVGDKLTNLLKGKRLGYAILAELSEQVFIGVPTGGDRTGAALLADSFPVDSLPGMVLSPVLIIGLWPMAVDRAMDRPAHYRAW